MRYLNTVPLVWGMLEGPQKGLFDLDFCLPSECADRLRDGRADIGIVPAVEVERLGLEVIPGAGIACRGAVRSILLVTKVPPEKVRTLAADSSSRTSVMLARIVLARRYGAEPRFFSHPPDVEAMLAKADAALLIGDPALRVDIASLPHRVLDLGEEWFTMTGLPMVFAVWASRPGIPGEALNAAFLDSCRFGIEHIAEIVRAEAAARRIPAERALDYLKHRVVFEIGECERAGMRLFLDWARDFAPLAAEEAVAQ